MPPSLDNAVTLVAPGLSPELVSPRHLSSIIPIAALLPAMYRGIFECRLESADAPVDFHQCIVAGHGEPALLAQHISTSSLSVHPIWQRIEHFCRLWADSSSELNKVINNIWLEFDAHLPLSALPVPAVFIAFGGERFVNRSLREYWIVAQTALDALLVKPLSERVLTNVYRCAATCPTDAGITHLGVMLSRSGDLVRLNVMGLPPKQLGHYLTTIGWPGSVDDAAALYAQLTTRADSVVVCLDVGEEVSSSLGFECFIKRKDGDDSRWTRFFGELVDEGICSVSKRDACLAWPGLLAPDTSPQLWPGDLIAQSLVRPPATLSMFIKRISHVKIGYRPGAPLEAKAYLWFAHNWVELSNAIRPTMDFEGDRLP